MGLLESIRLAVGDSQELKHAIEGTLYAYCDEYTVLSPVSTFQTLLKYSDEQIVNQVYKRNITNQNNGHWPKLIHYSDDMSYAEICTFNSVLTTVWAIPKKVSYLRSKNPQTPDGVKGATFSMGQNWGSGRYNGSHRIRQLHPTYQDFVFLKSTGLKVGNSPNTYDEGECCSFVDTFMKEHPNLAPGSPAFDQKLLEDSPTSLEYIRRNNLSYEMCLKAVKGTEGRANWKCLEYVPEKFLSREVCDIAVSDFYQALDFVPAKLIDSKMMINAVRQTGSAIHFLSVEKIPYETGLIAIKDYPFIYGEVPDEFRTKEMQDIMVASLYDGLPEHIRSCSIEYFGKDQYARTRGFAYYLVENLRGCELSELDLGEFANSIENIRDKQNYIDQYPTLTSFVRVGIDKGSDALKVSN